MSEDHYVIEVRYVHTIFRVSPLLRLSITEHRLALLFLN